jgi:broad specificity phosphatase PhoE
MGVIYLIRHGQAQFNAEDYDQLCPSGIRQAEIVGSTLRPRLKTIDTVVCGNMRRHQETAEHCLRAMNLANSWQEDAGWDEYDFQDIIAALEPRYRDLASMKADLVAADNPRAAFQALLTKALSRWVKSEHDSTYRESWGTFRARIDQSLCQLATSLQKSQNALVFTSGGPIAAVCSSLLNIPDEHTFRLSWTLTNAGLTKLIVSSRGTYLSTINEHNHFEDHHTELITYR